MEGVGGGLVPPVHALPRAPQPAAFMPCVSQFQPPPPGHATLSLTPRTCSLWNDPPSPGVGGTRGSTFVEACVLLLGWWLRARGPVLSLLCVWGPLSGSQASVCTCRMDAGAGEGSPFCPGGPLSRARSAAKCSLGLLPGSGRAQARRARSRDHGWSPHGQAADAGERAAPGLRGSSEHCGPAVGCPHGRRVGQGTRGPLSSDPGARRCAAHGRAPAAPARGDGTLELHSSVALGS